MAFLSLEVLHLWLEYLLIKFLLLVTRVAVVSNLFRRKSPIQHLDLILRQAEVELGSDARTQF